MALKEITAKDENGIRVSDIAKQYNMAKSTLYDRKEQSGKRGG